MTGLLVNDLTEDEFPVAAGVLGRGMRDNPLHVQAFGSDPSRREAALIRMFQPVVVQVRQKGRILAAYDDGILVGVCGMVAPGRCQASTREKLRVLPGVIRVTSLRTTLALLRWVSVWSRLDPVEAHWHLGPVAVEPDRQGSGIGSALLRAFSRIMDESRATAYLETDKESNVPFYERFGFRVLAQRMVLGTPNWFMLRRAR